VGNTVHMRITHFQGCRLVDGCCQCGPLSVIISSNAALFLRSEYGLSLAGRARKLCKKSSIYYPALII